MNIQGLNKAAVLAALYNASSPKGKGLAQYNPNPMTLEEARTILDTSSHQRFNYLKGRALKIRLADDEVDTQQYNRNNGEGAAEKAIESLQ